MTIQIFTMSQTGNTAKVADAILNACPEGTESKVWNADMALENRDLTFVGFPVQQFGIPAAFSRWLQGLEYNGNVAVFYTHAVPVEHELNDKIKAELTALIPQDKLAGIFHCQGSLGEKIAAIMVASENPMLQNFGKMREMTLPFPAEDDLCKAENFAACLLEGFTEGETA